MRKTRAKILAAAAGNNDGTHTSELSDILDDVALPPRSWESVDVWANSTSTAASRHRWLQQLDSWRNAVLVYEAGQQIRDGDSSDEDASGAAD